jgi:hypothetical protein
MGWVVQRFDLPLRLLKDVLGCISRKHEFLQHAFVGGVHLIHGPGLIGLFAELNQLALRFHVLNLVFHRLKHHDVLLPFHGVPDEIFACRQQSSRHPSRGSEINFPRFPDSETPSRHREGNYDKNAHH